MTVADLLAELRRLDVHVTVDGDRLRLNAPAGVLTDEHKHELTQRKYEVIAFLRDATQLVEQQRAIVPLQATGTRTPIFAVAGHNGDVFAYRALAEQLDPDQPLFGLQPPGLEEGTRPLTRVEDIVGYFAEQIRAFRPAGPLSIAGYCAGGTIAFALARELANSGTSVTNLVLFGAPYCTSYRRLHWTATWARYYAGRCVTHARTLRTIPAGGRAGYLSARVRTLRARGDTVSCDPVLIRRHAVEEATMAAVRAYSPLPSGNHIDIMVPCQAWRHSWAHPLRWRRLGASSAVYAGPDDCASDTMLLPEHAPTFATFVAEAQRCHTLAGPPTDPEN